MDDDIATLVAVTGVGDTVARQLLQLANGDANQAISLYFDNPDVVANMNTDPTSAAAPSLPPIQRVSAGSRSNRAGRQDESGVIHIDSDDDEADNDSLDMDVDMDDPDASFGASNAAAVARSAQEEEDAAMARRMQEELYGSGPGPAGGDEVRAPIGRTTETLVAPGGYGGPGDDDDMHAAVLEQLRRRQHRPARTQNGPFSQSVWDGGAPPGQPGQPGPASNPAASSTRHQARLAELFRPPFDLISDLTWDQARDEGREDKKWILVNIQDMANFDCQVLNRDIWKDDSVRQLVQESFIFLQYTKEDFDAQQYIQYYLANGLHENPDNYPHVAIVDPRTGEQVKVWSGKPFPNAMEFYAQLAEFLDRYSLAANSKNPVAKTKPKETVKDVDRMTEEEMLEMAMQASLQTTNGASSTAGPSIQDPDLLTASQPAAEAGSSSAAEAPPSTAESAFARISAEKPHTEPTDPSTTTRIQFRHAGGRVIRRFTVTDPVVRVYEWLKAEPLEGKDGMEFELKLMPAGRDLIEDLDKTVEEAGLKNATVMIEYIEP